MIWECDKCGKLVKGKMRSMPKHNTNLAMQIVRIYDNTYQGIMRA